jgi:RNA polymerase sigma-70 factor (ECF subfamily)
VTTVVDSLAEADRHFEAAFARDWRPLFRFALASTNDVDAAEDLAQDAFARLWQRRAQIDWSRPPLPWLMVTAQRLATDRFRRLQRRLLPVTTGSSDNASRDRWLDTRAAMSRLSRTERVAIVMNALEGYPAEEVADLLGISAGAVRAAVSRARRKLEDS